jgi:hypothetical protein
MMICLNKITQDGDKWTIRYNAFKAAYDEEFAAFSEAYDTDGDGNISDTENDERPMFANVELKR